MLPVLSISTWCFVLVTHRFPGRCQSSELPVLLPLALVSGLLPRVPVGLPLDLLQQALVPLLLPLAGFPSLGGSSWLPVLKEGFVIGALPLAVLGFTLLVLPKTCSCCF